MVVYTSEICVGFILNFTLEFAFQKGGVSLIPLLLFYLSFGLWKLACGKVGLVNEEIFK